MWLLSSDPVNGSTTVEDAKALTIGGKGMKKTLFWLCLAILFSLSAFSAVRITVTIQPYYLILEELKTSNVEVRRLIDASQNPHTFSPSVGQGKLLYDSGIILYNGLHLENDLEPTLESIKHQGKTVIAVSDWISSAVNPHIWLDPVWLGEEIIPGLRELLLSVDPENRDHYLSESQRMIEEIERLHLELKAYLSAYTGKTVIMSHPSFAYFFERYGLKLDSIFEGEGDEPTAGKMKALIDGLKDRQVIALFLEPQQPRRYVEILAKEGKIAVGTLDPLGWNAPSIIQLLRSNFEEIKRVFP